MSDNQDWFAIARTRRLTESRRAPRPPEYQPSIPRDDLGKALKQVITNLRMERDLNDQRAAAAARRSDAVDQHYWLSRADGLSAGIAAVRDLLFALTGEDV